MPSILSIKDLFIRELADMHSVEMQLATFLPLLSHAAASEELADAFLLHAQETQGQIDRIERIAELMDVKLKRHPCTAMDGLTDESRGVMSAMDQGTVRDAALIDGAQKMEHYEIAAYGTLCTLARQLGLKHVASLLEESLQEQKDTDAKLAMLSHQAHARPLPAGEFALQSRAG